MQHRPKYHFLPEKNWMNDPNATIFFKGLHHIFYQYNPTDWHWGNLHWGHATSKDLLHWEHQPIALYPQHDRGEIHCYSGCSYIHNDSIELFYTSVGEGDRCQEHGAEQWVATTDDLITWKQIPENPVIKGADHPWMTLSEWRDPFVFKYNGENYALVAGVVNEQHGAVHIYKSSDMRHWEYLNEFFTTDEVVICECPNLVVFGDKVLFMHSILSTRIVRYFVGTIGDDYKLKIETRGSVDFGDFFATQISYDDKGRTLLWAWLREDARAELLTDGEWAGVQAIPRIITLNEENKLEMRRLPEVETLRKSGEKVVLNDFKGVHSFKTVSNTIEIEAEILTDSDVKLSFLRSEDGREHTDIIISPEKGTYTAVLEESSLYKEVDKRSIEGTFDVASDGKIRIDVLVDCSLAEIFLNSTSCISVRVYPTLDSRGILFSSDSTISSAEINVYEMEL